MAQLNLITHTRKVRVGYESTFGTAATNMKTLVVDGPAPILAGLSAEMLAVADMSPFMEDPTTPVQGLRRGGKLSLKALVRRLSSRLNAAASPVAWTNSAALSHQILLGHWLGGEAVGAGSTCPAGASTAATTIDVASGHGARFLAGKVIGITHASGVLPYLVTARSTDTLTLWPALRADVATDAVVLNSYQWHRAESHSSSLTVQEAYYEASPAAQQQAVGCFGAGKLSLAVGQIPAVEMSLEHSDFTGPTSGIISDMTAEANDMGAPIVWTPEVILQTGDTAVTYVCDSFSVDIPNTWTRVAQGDGVGATNAVVRTQGKTNPVTWELVVRMDPAEYTAFTASTERYLMLSATGSGYGFGVLLPRAVITARPQGTDKDGLLYVSLKGIARANTVVAGSPLRDTANTDLAASPVSIFLY